MSGEPSTRRRRSAAQRSPAPVVERVAGLASLAVVLVCLGTVGYQIASTPDPPRIDVTVDAIRTIGSQYYVYVTARNTGREVAAEVTVAGRLEAESGTFSRSAVTFDYLPGQGQRRGALMFDRDPSQGKLEVGVESYREP